MKDITVDEVLKYLSKYLAEPSVSTGKLLAEVPEWWQRVLVANDDERIRLTLEAWKPYQNQLPSVCEFLSAHLRNVMLLTDKNLVTGSMNSRRLYQMEKDGRFFYYAGGNPIRKTMPDNVHAAWSKLPSDFRQFYDSFHNGWYYVASNSMGPSPTEDFFILDDLEWGILEDIDDPGCNLKDLLAVYTNGMGGYVALSVEGNKTYGNVLWWKDKAPRLNIDAWAVMDAWTQIRLSK